LKFTTEVETKPVPFTVNVNDAAPAIALAGESVVIVGTGLLIVSVAAGDVPPPGAGFVTVINPVPAAAISAAVIVAVTCVPLLNDVALGDPLKFTVDVEIKFVPFTANENVGPPAVVAFGTSDVIVGSGLFAAEILKLMEFDVPPPGVGFVTETGGVPAAATSAAEIAAVNWVALPNVVVRALPLKFTVAPLTKFAPVTVNVNAPEPAVVPVGESAEIDGKGLPVPVPVIVNVMPFDGEPPGFVMVTNGVPGLATSAALTIARTKNGFSKSVNSAVDPKFTVQPSTKFVPCTSRTCCPDPAATVVGVIDVSVGTGLVTANTTELDGPPPGAGFVTITAGVPAVVMSAARIATVSCAGLTNVVARAIPPKVTVDALSKPVPFTVNVNACVPLIPFAGESVVITGTGFDPVTLNVTVFETPPPGTGFVTTTLRVPTRSTSCAKIAADICPEFTNVVTRGRPLKSTVAPFTKFAPFTVSVKSGPATATLGGARLVIAGTGFPAAVPPWKIVNVWQPKVIVRTRSGPVFCATV